MGNKELSISDKSNDIINSPEVSAASKDGHSQGRTNLRLMQNILLIWLDNNLDESNDDYLNTISQFRHVINTVHSFKDADACFSFVETIPDENVCMIISDTFGQHIVPCVHNMTQVVSIFIFCKNQQYHEQWVKDWSKIKGVFTEPIPICEALKQEVEQYEHNAISINFINTTDDIQKDKLDCSFMYTQLLKDTLLEIDFKEEHIQQFIEYCSAQFINNDRALQTIRDLEARYREHSPIWWYTCESFLYPMVNRTLRTMDVDMIVTMGFFITDLHRNITELHSQQFLEQNTFNQMTLYRGQGLSKEDFDQLMKTKSGLMAFNNFLSTSKNRRISLGFARRTLSNPSMIGILFVMRIDSAQSTTPFASVANVGYYHDREEEILLSMHSVFRIQNIKPMTENDRLFEVDLILTGQTDQDLRILTEYIRKETGYFSGWNRLSELLFKMGQFNKAEEVCQAQLDRTTIEIKKGPLYHQLGWIKSKLGQYSEALKYYEKSLKIYDEILPSNHISLAATYNNIGDVYSQMGEYLEALSYYKKDLEISLRSLPPNHPDLGTSYSNMGGIYRDLAEYSKALSCFKKALEIQKESLPSNHPNLGNSYESISAIHHNKGENPQALHYYEKGLEIKKQSLPSNHPDLAYSYDTMGMIYSEMNELSKALSFFQQALEIRQEKLSSNHPDLSISYNNIANVYYIRDDYSKALSYLLQSLTIQQESLSPNHPNLGTLYNNIANNYYQTNDDFNAKSYYEKSLQIQEQSLPPNHPTLGMICHNIAMVYENIGDNQKALSFYQRAFDIAQYSLPSNHLQVQTAREGVERMKNKS